MPLCHQVRLRSLLLACCSEPRTEGYCFEEAELGTDCVEKRDGNDGCSAAFGIACAVCGCPHAGDIIRVTNSLREALA